MLSASNAEIVTHSFLTSDSFCTFFECVGICEHAYV